MADRIQLDAADYWRLRALVADIDLARRNVRQAEQAHAEWMHVLVAKYPDVIESGAHYSADDKTCTLTPYNG